MTTTDTWERVIDPDGKTSVRKVHEDTDGRKCVRYKKKWRLIVPARDMTGRSTYRIGGEV